MTDLSIEQRFPAVFKQSLMKRFLPLLLLVGVVLYVAYAVWFLASAYTSYVTGQVFSVDGGFKME